MSLPKGSRGSQCLLVTISLLLGPALGAIGTPDQHLVSEDPRADETVLFTDVTNSSGLGWGSRHRVAWGDYDNDGRDDLLFNGRDLWRNSGNGSFHRTTYAAGIDNPGARGGVWGDYDNDGDLDLYQLHGTEGDDRLFRNNGDGTFMDVTSMAKDISDGGLPSEGAAWGDMDNDGFLDLYVANYEDPPSSSNGTYDVLYHNNGDGTFSNITSAAGMLVDPMCGRGVAWGDYNDDGFLDIYVANYRLNKNFLWRNNGDGTFTDVAEDLGVEGDLVLGYYGHSIGAAWGDIDNDGDLDLFVANLAHPRFILFSDISKLYINNGAPDYTFTDVPIQSRGIKYEETHSDPSFADYDNDGDLDLFITSVYDGRPTFLYRNDGTGSFTDVTDEAGTVTDNGWGAGWGDYDKDGDMDLVVGSGNSTKFRLFENGGNGNHWLAATLQGITSNALGIGARVELEMNDTLQIREVQGGRGTSSEDHIGVHFGLGDWEGLVNVSIRWPSGIIQRLEGLDTDMRTVFVEPPARTDFMFKQVTFKKDTVLQGENVTFDVVVENQGTVTGDADIELRISGFGSISRSPSVRALHPFDNVTFEIRWDTQDMGGDRSVSLEIIESHPQEDKLDDNIWVHLFHVNERPVALIFTLEPPVAYQGLDVVTFEGNASDDGIITGAEWWSDQDGVLSNLMSFSIPASGLSLGIHTIGFRVSDELGVWSSNDTRSLMVQEQPPSRPPVARIIDVDPMAAVEGETVHFEGEGSDPDGNVVGYRWESSLDGTLSSERIFSTSELSVGAHVISFFVIDDTGRESDPDTAKVDVKASNNPPTAVIDIIAPNPAKEGEKVRFQGRGIDDKGQVSTFIWTSDMDGILSYDYNFVTTDLSVGVHTIGLKVKDDDGEWSSEVYETLEVLAVNEPPAVTIDRTVERSDDVLRIEGTALDRDGEIVLVEVRIGNDDWLPAVPVNVNWSEWYFDVRLDRLDPGIKRVSVRASDGTDVSEEVYTDVRVPGNKGIEGTVTDMVLEAITGKNMPCLLVLVVFVGAFMIVAWAIAKGTSKDKERSPAVKDPGKKKGRSKVPSKKKMKGDPRSRRKG